MNYYEILGVAQTASSDEIKKAYRSLSLKLHPDRNKDPNAEDQYKSINVAYETLSDVTEKQKYDMMLQTGGIGGGSGSGGGMFNPFNVPEFHPFGNIFHNFSAGGGGGGGMPGPSNIRIFTHGPMPQFHAGGGGGGHIDIEQLFNALHTGMSTHIQKPIPILQNITITLEQVLTGANIPVQIEKWSLDNGTKIFEIDTIYVDIPKGISDNEIIILREKGNSINEHNIGDIKLTVSIQNNTKFKRSGLDLIYTHTITLKESLCGFKFELQYLNGKTYNINNTSGKVIVPGHVTTIPSLGLTRNDISGCLQIHFIIEFPVALTDTQIEQLQQIL